MIGPAAIDRSSPRGTTVENSRLESSRRVSTIGFSASCIKEAASFGSIPSSNRSAILGSNTKSEPPHRRCPSGFRASSRAFAPTCGPARTTAGSPRCSASAATTSKRSSVTCNMKRPTVQTEQKSSGMSSLTTHGMLETEDIIVLGLLDDSSSNEAIDVRLRALRVGDLARGRRNCATWRDDRRIERRSPSCFSAFRVICLDRPTPAWH